MSYPTPFRRTDRGNIWYFKYTDIRTGKRIQKSTNTTVKRDAQNFIHDFMNSLDTASSSNLTMAQLLKPWTTGETNPRHCRYMLEGKQYGTRHVKDIAYLLKNIEKHPITGMKVAYVTRGVALNLREWLHSEQLKGKDRSVNRVMSALRSICNEEIYRGNLKSNPFAGISQIAFEEKKKTLLTPEQILKLLQPENFPSSVYCQFVSTLAMTGMRLSEAAAMSWGSIQNGVLAIDRAFKSDSADDIGLPKWGKVRTIPLPKRLQTILGKPGSGLVFQEKSHRIYNKKMYLVFKKALKMAELPETSPHALRHVLNSRLLVQGISPFLLQKYFGWSQGSDLTRVQAGYTHVGAADLLPVADAIDQLFTAAEKAQPAAD